MLIQKGFLLRSLGNFTGQAKTRFFRPIPTPTDAALQRSRLFNLLLLIELILFLIALPATFLLNNGTRLFSATIILFAGAAFSFALAKGGRYVLAAWANLCGVLLGLTYYNFIRLSNWSILDGYDFRAGVVLLIYPILVAGLVVRTRVAVAMTGFTLLVLLVLGFVTAPYSSEMPFGVFSYYNQLFRTPFTFIILTSLTSIVYERNLLHLCARLCNRNNRFQTLSDTLNSEVEKAEILLATLGEALVSLEKIFEDHLSLAASQETATLEVREWQHQLRQSNRQFTFLVSQASDFISDSQSMVAQRGEVIRTNSAVFNRLQQLLELISHSVEELALASVQIEQVVGSISEVAEETNLLALNASIEAAGHLEQGRRFTMVASEVYRLAMRSRDAAEEVRQVASEIQGSVNSLANVSSKGRDQAQELAQTARSAPALVDQLTALMDSLAQSSALVFNNIRELQTGLAGLLAELSEATGANEPSTYEIQQLVDDSRFLRQRLGSLNEPEPASLRELATSSGKDGPVAKLGYLHQFIRDLFQKISPDPRLRTARRRQSRLIDNLCFGYCIFMVFYFGLSLFVGSEIISILPSAFLLVLLLVVYCLNKIGLSTYALLGFFATNYAFFTVVLLSLKTQADYIDSIRQGSAMFSITILVAAIIADLGWVFWITLLSMAWTAGLAFIFVSQPFTDILQVLVYPLSLQAGIGLLAGCLYFNVNHLSLRVQNQNRDIALAYRKKLRRKTRILALSQKLTEEIAAIRQSFETQAHLARLRFEVLAEISEKVETQGHATTHQIAAIRQIGQTVSHAVEQVKSVVRETDTSQRLLIEFQGGVAEISTNSEALKIHTGEIGQIFELITIVADEIDLLALNATLEAAQAREAGKRFGAVAGEIQRLAGRARQTGAKVQTVISNVEEAVELCAQLTERGLNELYILTQSASESTLSTHTVIEVVGAGQKMVQQLEAAVQEQTEFLDQLTRELQNISAAGGTVRPKIQAGFDLLQELQDLVGSLGNGKVSATTETSEPTEAAPALVEEPT